MRQPLQAHNHGNYENNTVSICLNRVLLPRQHQATPMNGRCSKSKEGLGANCYRLYVYELWYNMIIRCYRLNARPCFFFFFFLLGGGGGGGGPKNKKTSICIMDLHNLQQLWISIIALWVNMFARLWISICSVLAVHYGYPWYKYGYP